MMLFIPILAEVSDKMPTFGDLWSQSSIAICVCGALAWTRRWWSVSAAVFLALVFAWFNVRWLLYDPVTGWMIREERGPNYTVTAWISGLAPLVTCTVLWLFRKSRPQSA